MPGIIHNVLGVIFDLDGTLIDSFGAIVESYTYAADRLGLPFMANGEFRGKIGVPLEDFFAQAVSPDKVPEAVRLFRERYSGIYLTKTTLMKDAGEVVRELHGRGIRLGVATNKLGRFSRDILTHLGMGTYFSSILGAGDGIPPKPAPDILLTALKEIGVEKSRALYIGDAPIDIETGNNAGISIIAIATGYYTERELRSAGAWRVLSRLRDILSLTI